MSFGTAVKHLLQSSFSRLLLHLIVARGSAPKYDRNAIGQKDLRLRQRDARAIALEEATHANSFGVIASKARGAAG
jgi:hypothetical protein